MQGTLDRDEGPPESILGFWLRGRCYGIDVRAVAEVLTVEALVPVPLTQRAVQGLFTLRGTPVALVDIAELLALSDEPAVLPGSCIGLVLMSDEVRTAAIRGDRLISVLSGIPQRFTPAGRFDEHPAVHGFADAGPEIGMVTVLRSSIIAGALHNLRFRRG
jgi:chemotaxis signal transduction protein